MPSWQWRLSKHCFWTLVGQENITRRRRFCFLHIFAVCSMLTVVSRWKYTWKNWLLWCIITIRVVKKIQILPVISELWPINTTRIRHNVTVFTFSSCPILKRFLIISHVDTAVFLALNPWSESPWYILLRSENIIISRPSTSSINHDNLVMTEIINQYPNN